MILQIAPADGGAGARALLRKTMGTSAGLERRSVEDDLCNYETADYAICRCDVRPGLIDRDGIRRTYCCRECGTTVTEGGQR